MEQDPNIRLSDGEITLRKPVAADAAALVQMCVGSIDHLLPWMAWLTPDYSEQGALDFINGVNDPTGHPFLVEDAAGALVGTVGLSRIEWSNRIANLGYWLVADSVGKGYASRGTDLVIRYALDRLGLERVEIMMSVENEPSRKVAERSLATYEGVQRARLRYEERQHDVHCFVALACDLSPHV